MLYWICPPCTTAIHAPPIPDCHPRFPKRLTANSNTLETHTIPNFISTNQSSIRSSHSGLSISSGTCSAHIINMCLAWVWCGIVMVRFGARCNLGSAAGGDSIALALGQSPRCALGIKYLVLIYDDGWWIEMHMCERLQTHLGITETNATLEPSSSSKLWSTFNRI